MLKKIISGGQTGADRAALDTAIKLDIPHGGWIPKGRITETGPLPASYQLQEMPTDSYSKRTEQNVIDSDGTLIIARGSLTGGTDYSRLMTLKHHKQLLGIDLNLTNHYAGASLVAPWIDMQHIQVLNVAGPRASEDSAIYSDVCMTLELAILTFGQGKSISEAATKSSVPTKSPETVDEAVERLAAEMSLKEKSTIANTAEVDLIEKHISLVHLIRIKFLYPD